MAPMAMLAAVVLLLLLLLVVVTWTTVMVDWPGEQFCGPFFLRASLLFESIKLFFFGVESGDLLLTAAIANCHPSHFLLLHRLCTHTHTHTHSLVQKSPRFYPAEDVKPGKKVHRVKQNPPRIRKSITPGTILIILAGRFRGKRVVCLKALESGLLLVTGPYKINGVPLRRVNQSYVIATSTKIDVSKVDVSKINDEYFSRAKDPPRGEGESDFFEGDAPKPAVVSDERKSDQQKVDGALLKVVAATDMLEGYLAARFTLTASDKPHLMKF